jgi:hypothetical protein
VAAHGRVNEKATPIATTMAAGTQKPTVAPRMNADQLLPPGQGVRIGSSTMNAAKNGAPPTSGRW